MKVSIIAPALGIEKSIVDRFVDRAIKAGINKENIYIDNSPLYGVLNLSRVRNRLIRLAIKDKPDVIIQTDIDCLFTQDTIKQTMQSLEVADVFNIAPAYPEVVKGSLDDLQTYFEGKRGQTAYGGWNAAKTTTWERIGGFDERCYGYGWEDNLFSHRCQHLGMNFLRSTSAPLLHFPHVPNRFGFKREGRFWQRKNVKFTSYEDQPNYLNYCDEGLKPWVTIGPVSKCLRSCTHCSQQVIRAKFPDYIMTWEEYSNWLAAIKGEPLSVVFTGGGEPVYWPYLEDAIVSANKQGHETIVFTARPDCLSQRLLNHLTILKISVYEYGRRYKRNYRKLFGPNVTYMKAQRFYPLPTKDMPEMAGGGCGCDFPFFYANWIWRCGNIGDVLCQKNLDLYSQRSWCEPFGNYFWYINKFPPTGINHCTFCVGNRRYQKTVGKVRNVPK